MAARWVRLADSAWFVSFATLFCNFLAIFGPGSGKFLEVAAGKSREVERLNPRKEPCQCVLRDFGASSDSVSCGNVCQSLGVRKTIQENFFRFILWDSRSGVVVVVA